MPRGHSCLRVRHAGVARSALRGDGPGAPGSRDEVPFVITTYPTTRGNTAAAAPGSTPGGAIPLLGVSTSVFSRAFDRRVIDALDTTGIPVVEVVGPVPACPFDEPAVRRELRARLRDARVRVRSVHLPYGSAYDLSQTDPERRAQAVASTAAHLRAAAALGTSLAVVHPSAEPIAGEDRRARLDAARRSLEVLAPLAAGLGVPLAVECLPRSCLGNTAAELAALLDGLDPDAAGTCIDVNHLNLREPDLARAVSKLGDRLLTLHCSDNDGLDERHWLPGAPGGVVDWDGFSRGLVSAGYRGPFLYELRPLEGAPEDTLGCIAENYRSFVTPRWRAAQAAEAMIAAGSPPDLSDAPGSGEG